MIYWIFNQLHFLNILSVHVTIARSLQFVCIDCRNNLKSKFQFVLYIYWLGDGCSQPALLYTWHSSFRNNLIATQFICNLYIKGFMQSNVICRCISDIWTCATYPIGNIFILLLILIQSDWPRDTIKCSIAFVFSYYKINSLYSTC